MVLLHVRNRYILPLCRCTCCSAVDTGRLGPLVSYCACLSRSTSGTKGSCASNMSVRLSAYVCLGWCCVDRQTHKPAVHTCTHTKNMHAYLHRQYLLRQTHLALSHQRLLRYLHRRLLRYLPMHRTLLQRLLRYLPMRRRPVLLRRLLRYLSMHRRLLQRLLRYLPMRRRLVHRRLALHRRLSPKTLQCTRNF